MSFIEISSTRPVSTDRPAYHTGLQLARGLAFEAFIGRRCLARGMDSFPVLIKDSRDLVLLP
ncbi:MAG: hypothetical protein AAB319_10465, partial [Pseudomonadota bacterium]